MSNLLSNKFIRKLVEMLSKTPLKVLMAQYSHMVKHPLEKLILVWVLMINQDLIVAFCLV